jgi:hypothetical protein
MVTSYVGKHDFSSVALETLLTPYLGFKPFNQKLGFHDVVNVVFGW